MPNSWFRFKQFTINQDKCAMKVGTDSILLGAWANIKNRKNILDIGTGTGILSLMAAQRCDAKIIGIEIDKYAVLQAKENINNSPWKNKINIIHTSLQDFNPPVEKFDMIISNPPFFQDSLKSPEKSRTHARHNETLKPGEIINFTLKHLSEKGLLAIIWPVEQGNKFIHMASEKNLFCQRITYVKPNPSKLPHRSVMELGLNNTNLLTNEIIIENGTRHHYTKEYKKLTEDYYLNF